VRRKFKLRCFEVNPKHVKFYLFDVHGANCGCITVDAEDARDFIKFDWNGDVDWNGLTEKIP